MNGTEDLLSIMVTVEKIKNQVLYLNFGKRLTAKQIINKT